MKNISTNLIILLLFQFISLSSAFSICKKEKIVVSVIRPFKYNKPIGNQKAEEVTKYFCRQLESSNSYVETIDKIDITKNRVNFNIRSSVDDLTIEELVNLGFKFKSDFIIRGFISKLDSVLILTIWVIKIDSAYKKVFTVKSLNANFDSFKKYRIKNISKSINEYIIKQK
ncbi:MAG: hypothetical protein GF329_10815 [Candidatus Lokiarchaeota archaeon]|nr:hypothetical protein [Candidatus Lokiarchaeota archaeon]